MLRIGVLVSGGGTNLQAIIDATERREIDAEIVTVVSSNAKAYALERAQKYNIPAVCILKKQYATRAEYTEAIIEHLLREKIGLILLAGFNLILTERFTEVFKNMVMNVHSALIPSFCGAGFYGMKVHEAVLAKGVKLTGATVHFVNEETDGGPIIIQKAVAVDENDTPETLQKRVMQEAEWVAYVEAVRLFAENRLKVEGNIVRILS